MEDLALVNDLKPKRVKLDHLYLDPNNPRFFGMKSRRVPDSRIASEEVQERTKQRLIDRFDVDGLRENMEMNGYLPMDHIVVAEFDTDKYVVLEGNRRVCAAKLIAQAAAKDGSIHETVVKSVKELPCLVYTGRRDADTSWMFQGLRHISGIREWPAFNKAKLLVEQMEANKLNLTEVGKRFGISSHSAGQWVRAYYAFKQASTDSEYAKHVDEPAFPFFQELFSRSNAPLREWMDWNETTHKFRDLLKFNEFVGWLYDADPGAEDNGEEPDIGWDNRVIPRAIDVRKVTNLLVTDPEVFEEFRRERNLEFADYSATSKKIRTEQEKTGNPEEQVIEAVESCTRAIEKVPFKSMKNSTFVTKLREKTDALKAAIEELLPE